jgi:hypothetical protein
MPELMRPSRSKQASRFRRGVPQTSPSGDLFKCALSIRDRVKLFVAGMLVSASFAACIIDFLRQLIVLFKAGFSNPLYTAEINSNTNVNSHLEFMFTKFYLYISCKEVIETVFHFLRLLQQTLFSWNMLQHSTFAQLEEVESSPTTRCSPPFW